MQTYIAHVDMDAFFAAVEERDHPAYRGRPVVIGADPKKGKGRGVVSTCSYEARKYGIGSAMPISIAYKKCPDAVFLPVDIEKYSQVSDAVFDVLEELTPDIEPISIDEAFLDITKTHHLFGSPKDTCLEMKLRIKSKTGLTASVGLAPVKMVAKIASEACKPDGFLEVKPEQMREFLRPLDIRKLWGIGKKSEEILKSKGVLTIGDIAKTDAKYLCRLLGSSGEHFWELANGIDEREVEAREEIKSISNEVTFDKDTKDELEIQKALKALCDKVSMRLRNENLKGRTITLKIRLEGFQTHTRSYTMTSPTNFFDVIYKEIQCLYKKFCSKTKKKIRLVGVKVSNFSRGPMQKDFIDQSDDEIREKRHKILDSVREKHGEEAMRWGGTI